MSSPYTGNPAGGPNLGPSPAPGPGAEPILEIPADTDPNNAATMFAQQYPTLADFDAYVASCVRLAAPHLPASASAFSSVSTSSFGGTVTPSGNPSAGIYRWTIQIQTGGAVGTATFKMSTNGGATYGALQTTAASMTDATTGITLAFSGTFTANGTATFFNAILPQALWLDSAGNARSIIDHLGYRRGRTREIYETWEWLPPSAALTGGPTQAAGTRWTYNMQTGSGLVGYLGTALAGPAVIIQSGTPNGTISYVKQAFTQILYQTYSSIVVEFDMFLANIGANHTDLQIGLNTNALVGTPSTSQIAATFLKRTTDTNWQGYTSNGSANTILDLGVSPVAGTAQQFLIELHGSGSPLGACAVFYINGAPVGQIATTLPTAGTQLCLEIIDEGNGGASTANATVGPMRCIWNPQLSVPLI